MIVKHSMTIRGHATSISVEDPFWQELNRIAAERGSALAALVAEIDAQRPPDANLSSAVRLFVLGQALDAARPDQKSSGFVTPGKEL